LQHTVLLEEKKQDKVYEKIGYSGRTPLPSAHGEEMVKKSSVNIRMTV